MVKAIALIRTSTDRQEIESQKEQVLQMCYNDGLKDDEVIIVGEQGASAIKLDDIYMKNLNYIYELIETNKSIKCVYAWAIDRIGRVESVLHTFREFLVKNQVQLKIRNPNLVLLDYYGKEQMGVKVQFSVYATLAAIEMDNKKERFKRAKERNKKNGKFFGGPRIMFGYCLDENKYFKPDEIHSKVVKEIFEEYASGKWSLRKLCTEMNNRGYKRDNKILTFETIKTCLYNGYKYCGVDTNVNYPPIITKELVDKVFELLKKNKKIQKSNYHHYFAHGILKCQCGLRMVVCHDHYRCISTVANGRTLTGEIKKCNSKFNNVSLRVLDGILWKIAKDCHERVIDDMNNDKKNELKKEKAIIEKKIKKFKKDLDTFSEKRNKLFERSILENMPDEVVESIKNKLKIQEDTVRKEYNMCEERLGRINATLSIGINKRRDNEIKFITMLNMEMNATEIEMNELVHKYISDVKIKKYEGETINGYVDWKSYEINIETIFGNRKFVYFPYARKRKNVFEFIEGEWDWFVYEDIIRDKEGYKLVLREYEIDD